MFYGDNSSDENARILRAAQDREILVTLTTYSKCGEGTNCKAWEIGFLVSSVADGKTVEQVAGRIRRTQEGKISPVVLYDYRYNGVVTMKNHGANRDVRYMRLGFENARDKNAPVFRRGF